MIQSYFLNYRLEEITHFVLFGLMKMYIPKVVWNPP